LFEGTQDEARATLPARLSITSRDTPVGLPGVIDATRSGTSNGWSEWDVRLAPGGDPGDLLQACTERGFALRRFEQSRPSLHDVFIHIVGGEEGRA